LTNIKVYVVSSLYLKVTCGSELALLFVETLGKGKIPYDDETFGAFLSFLYPSIFYQQFIF
jgi:hypothetical protein